MLHAKFRGNRSAGSGEVSIPMTADLVARVYNVK